MLGWLRAFGRRKAPLTGAPAVARRKNYSAQSGYVYQYFYQGHRAGAGGVEYVFEVSSDRRTFRPTPVLLEQDAVEQWQRLHQRELAPNERYAAVKLALFQAFDERPEPALLREEVRVRAADLEVILVNLGIE